jgi:hypothetical protein
MLVRFAKIVEELFPAAGVNGGEVHHVVQAFDGVLLLGLVRDFVNEEADLGNVAVTEEK